MNLKMHSIVGAVLLVLAMTTAGGEDQAQNAMGGQPGELCAKLKSTDFSLTEDAPAEITAASPLKGSDTAPDTCVVEGVVWPNVRFRVEFPLTGARTLHQSSPWGATCMSEKSAPFNASHEGAVAAELATSSDRAQQGDAPQSNAPTPN